MRKYLSKRTFALFLLVMLSIGAVGSGEFVHHAQAGPQVVGNPKGSTVRYLVADGNNDGGYKQIVYVAAGAKTMANTTPVTSDTFCGVGNRELFTAKVALVGTMGGTNPTLTILWQQSMDGGTTWENVGTWTQINATVTPAVQTNSVSDIWNNTTAVAYGDCWRASYQFGGTGTVTANISIIGADQ